MASKVRVMTRTVQTVCKKSKSVTSVAKAYSVWSQDRIVKSPYKKFEVSNTTLYDYIWLNMDRWPERTATVCAITGRGYTYEQAFKLSNAFAANLRKKFKLHDGDAVAIMLPNLPDYPLVALGILEAGGIVTTLNPAYTPHEIQRQLVTSDAKIVVTLPEKVKIVKEALKLAKLRIPIIAVTINGEPIPEGVASFSELSQDIHVDKSCLKEVRRSPKDICFLPYSSGTTGLPKGVELSNRNIVANCEQISDSDLRSYSETTAHHQDSVMGILPFYHVYAATVIMFHKLAQGIKVVTMPTLQPEAFFNALAKFKTNIIFVAPPLVLMMSTHPAAKAEHYKHLDIVTSGAAPLASADVERLFEKTKRKFNFVQGYGLTETSPVIALSSPTSTNYGSVGHAVPNTELKIVDNNLRALGPDETGELLVRGPQVMRGYRNNPQANAESFTSDGWYRTGDLATINDDGEVFIADRLKELIKVKGLQVPPAELESVLRDHPSVADAAVVGVPHSINGEAPKAFVVLKKDTQCEPRQIKEFVAEKVAPYKRLDDVVFIDSIPKSAAGKILRKVIKEKYC